MPSTTRKMAGLMAGCDKNRSKMRVKCPPPKVAKEFHRADIAKAARKKP